MSMSEGWRVSSVFSDFWSYTFGNFEGFIFYTYANPLCQYIFHWTPGTTMLLLKNRIISMMLILQSEQMYVCNWCHSLHNVQVSRGAELKWFAKCWSWQRATVKCLTACNKTVFNETFHHVHALLTYRDPPAEGRPSGEQPGCFLQLPQHMGKLCLRLCRL